MVVAPGQHHPDQGRHQGQPTQPEEHPPAPVGAALIQQLAGQGLQGACQGRLAGGILVEYAAALRKLKDARPPKEVADDIQAQLQRLMPKRFVASTPWPQLQHLVRYLKGVVMRLDKLRADPARDAQRLAELRPLEQRHVRRLAELKGQADSRLEDFRWQLEELRISLFAQELRTPQPVSVKRLEKTWAQLAG